MNASNKICIVITSIRISWCRLSIYSMLNLHKILLSSKNLYRKFTAASTSHHLWMEKERTRSTRGFPWVCIHAHPPSNLLYHFLKFTVGNLLLLLNHKFFRCPEMNMLSGGHSGVQNNRQTFIFSLEKILLLVCNLVFIWNVPRAMIGWFTEWREKSSAHVLQCCNRSSSIIF